MKRTEAASCGILQISDVEARVFKALLHYIYTDSLPAIDEGEAMDMARHLIAAADRYSLDRLKHVAWFPVKLID
jgi:speckle-type POZ protein